MKKYICEECMQKEYETEEDKNSPFPVFSIVGGIAGAATTFLTASLVLIPVGLLAGAGLDLMARCESCGSEENVYETMSAEEDEEGRTYSPLKPIGGESDSDSFWNSESESTPEKKYRYDEEEAKLVPFENQSSLVGKNSNRSDFDWSISTEQAEEKSPDVIDQIFQENVQSVTDENIKIEEDIKSAHTHRVDKADQKGKRTDLEAGILSELEEFKELKVNSVNGPVSEGGEE
jgi:hypothetical protein